MQGNTVFGLMVIGQIKRPGKGMNIAKNSLKGIYVKILRDSTEI